MQMRPVLSVGLVGCAMLVGCSSSPAEETLQTSMNSTSPTPSQDTAEESEGLAEAPTPNVSAQTGSSTGCPVWDGGLPATYEEQRLASAARWCITDPPDVEMIRAISPPETITVIAECMAESGWLPAPGAEPGEYTVPEGQEEAFGLARYTCEAAYPVAERYLGEFDTDQWAIVYDHWTSTFIPCARDLGVDIAEPPSREAFLADPSIYTAVDEQVLLQLPTLGLDADRLDADCPIEPPVDVLHPSN